jgi:hypothetical protein
MMKIVVWIPSKLFQIRICQLKYLLMYAKTYLIVASESAKKKGVLAQQMEYSVPCFHDNLSGYADLWGSDKFGVKSGLMLGCWLLVFLHTVYQFKGTGSRYRFLKTGRNGQIWV